jgi:hypothetical protein
MSNDKDTPDFYLEVGGVSLDWMEREFKKFRDEKLKTKSKLFNIRRFNGDGREKKIEKT